MVLDMKRAVIELEHRGVIPVKDAVGSRIDCLRGRIWITELGCTDDIVLEAGESHEIERVGVAVVQALRDAVVVLCAPAVPCTGLAARFEGYSHAGGDAHPQVASAWITYRCIGGVFEAPARRASYGPPSARWRP